MIEQIAAALGIKKSSVIAPAAVGALVAAIRASHLKVWQRVVTFLCGFGMATYLTHPVLAWFKWEDGFEHGVAFVLGLFGMTIVEALLTTDWKAIIQKRAGGA